MGGVDGLDGAWDAQLSPDGKHLYVAGRLEAALGVLSRNATTGALTFVESNEDGTGGVDGLNRAWRVSLSPDGKHAHVAAETDDAESLFSRNATTGALTFVDFQKDGVGGVDGLDAAVTVTLSPDGVHVYVGGGIDDSVAVFSRNTTTGSLTFVEVQKDGAGGVDGLDALRDVIVSPDGKHVYATGQADDAVAVFSRNATTGALTFVEVHKDGVGGVDGLDAASDLAVSPDGKHVYATGNTDDAVAVFSRNATTGALTFVEVLRDGVGGVDGLDRVEGLVISADGSHLYLAGNGESAVAVFSRNATTGALTFVEVLKQGGGGVDGLLGVADVELNPSGTHAYAASRGGEGPPSAVAVFSRNATTGALTFLEVKTDGVGGVDGLGGATGARVSPDGKHLYVAGRDEDSVAVFSLELDPSADLSIAKSANPTTVDAGQSLTYTLTATNGGPDTATSLTVSDTLPGNVTFVSAGAGCGESGGTVTCTAASLANGANVPFTITVTAPSAGGTISNTATVTSSTTDPNASNDSVTLVTTVNDSADLSIAKSANPTTVGRGH